MTVPTCPTCADYRGGRCPIRPRSAECYRLRGAGPPACRLWRPADPPPPRHDRDFQRRILADLESHPNEFRPLGRLYASHVDCWERCCVVRDAVDHWRHAGLHIVGCRGLGYMLTTDGSAPTDAQRQRHDRQPAAREELSP